MKKTKPTYEYELALYREKLEQERAGCTYTTCGDPEAFAPSHARMFGKCESNGRWFNWDTMQFEGKYAHCTCDSCF